MKLFLEQAANQNHPLRILKEFLDREEAFEKSRLYVFGFMKEQIALGRQIWNIVDIIVGVGLIITIFWKRK